MTHDRAATGALLWSRALVLSAVGWSSGTLAHVGADGRLPGPAVLLILLLGGTLLGVPLLRRPASAARTCVLVVLGQQAVHLALAVTAGHVTEHAEGGSQLVGLHGLHHAATEPLEEPGMLAAHLGAAVVCGWWLARGERALWLVLDLADHTLSGLVGLLAALLRRPRALVRTPGAARPDRTAWSDPRPPVLRLVGRALSRRGPPALVAA